MKYCLLTGATGLLGRYLMRDLLLRDRPLAVLVRPSRYETAAQRIDAVLTHWEQQWKRWLPRPVVLSGDINAPDLGLLSEQRRWVRQHCDQVLHSAASLAFQQEGEEPWRSNVEGLKNILSFAREQSVRHFLHISSCYVCGLRADTVYENELNVGQKFGNIYEESKAYGETLVHQADFLDAYTIFRPSIIVGDSDTGFSNTFHGFYTPLRLLSATASYVDHNTLFSINHREALRLQGHERKNFVPVQWVSEAIITLLERQAPQNRTFALATAKPTSVDQMYQVLETALRRFQPCISSNGSKTNLDVHSPEVQSMLENYFESFAVYKSYWRDDPQFDLTNTTQLLPDKLAPELTEESLLRLCQYALQHQFNWIPSRDALNQPTARDVMQHLQNGAGSKSKNDNWNRALTAELTITGPGGGSWTLVNKPNGLCCLEGALGASTQARLNSQTFAQLVAKHRSLAEAVNNGQLVVTGDASNIKLFEDAFSRLSHTTAAQTTTPNQR